MFVYDPKMRDVDPIFLIPTFGGEETYLKDFERICMRAYKRLADADKKAKEKFVADIVRTKLTNTVRQAFYSYNKDCKELSELFEVLKEVCTKCGTHVHDGDYYVEKMSMITLSEGESLKELGARFMILLKEAKSAIRCKKYRDPCFQNCSLKVKRMMVNSMLDDIEITACTYYESCLKVPMRADEMIAEIQRRDRLNSQRIASTPLVDVKVREKKRYDLRDYIRTAHYYWQKYGIKD